MKYSDLKNQTGTEGIRTILLCQNCDREASANASDYWNTRRDLTISCECGGEFIEGYFKTTFVKKGA